MAKYFKKAIAESAVDSADAKVQGVVAGIIADVKKRGDEAVRELSAKFDGWAPASFRLSQHEIDSMMALIPRETIDDITFAQDQIRKFAEYQKAALEDIEVETLPGVRLGHRNIPVGSAGCYGPGGRYPTDGCIGAHEHRYAAKVAGVRTDYRLHASDQRQSAPRNDCGNGIGWRRRNLRPGRSPGRHGNGSWYADDCPGRYARRPW